jgi:hypothetical protein
MAGAYLSLSPWKPYDCEIAFSSLMMAPRHVRGHRVIDSRKAFG